ncbi:MAG: MurR/RpiR family transcriptional regulator [Anaerolineae bacterium]
MFRERIQDKYDELSPRFRTLADFILENTLDVGFLTATALARRVDVDPATVVRFSQEIGYSGFRELSREIKDYINHQLALRYRRGDPEAEGLAEKIAIRADELSDRVLSLKADTDLIANAVEEIHDATRVITLTEGAAFGLASLWATYLNIIGIEAVAVRADVAEAALMLRDAEPGDLVFAISLGLDPDLMLGHLLGAARERGLTTIAVTTSPTLAPARDAEINLTVPSKTPPGYPFFDTLLGMLSLLWQGLIMLDKARGEAGIKGATETLRSLMERQDEVPQYDIAAVLRLWEQEE